MPHSASTISYKNSVILNNIRILATWLVLLGHAFSYSQITIFKDETHFAYIQNIGVIILFMLSGFLTAHSLHQKKTLPSYDYRHFLIDKFCRIIIPFIPAISFVVLLDKISMTLQPNKYHYYNSYNFISYIGNILQLQDIPEPNTFITSFGSARSFWTLSVEWWLFLLVGFIVLYFYPLFKHKSLHIKHILFLTVLALPSIYHLTGGRGNGLTFTYCLGIIIYFLHNRFIKTPQKHMIIITGISILSVIGCGIYKKSAYNNLFIMSIALCFCCLLIYGSYEDNHPSKANSNQKATSFLASYTYSLYLLHYSIMDFLSCITTLHSYSLFVTCIILSNIVAIVFYFLFEKNTKKLSYKTKIFLKINECKSEHNDRIFTK